ncbi:hypothetical protein KEJ27_03620 [Candidatus Bathyarchaeota archaeon]|nr:hypothetical protein [Candidatus Bathyarchaeota archaeon]MBS7613605.1 hypothetical protein [Candidatus Bathyarchaeota archaeon]MBS7618000.1 hypothetical protein [Candidatus Bathyarchaeota archaeon]
MNKLITVHGRCMANVVEECLSSNSPPISESSWECKYCEFKDACSRGGGGRLKIHRNIMEIRWRKYREVSKILVKRFCSKCLRKYGIGRSFKRIKIRCIECPVGEALREIEAGLKKWKEESWLEEKVRTICQEQEFEEYCGS